MSVLQFISMCTVVTLLVSGCSSEDSAAGLRGKTPDFSATDSGQCGGYSPLQGQDFQTSALQESHVDSGYFDKQWRWSQMELSFKASALSTARLLTDQGVRVYKVLSDPTSSCRYFNFLPDPDSDSLQAWRAQTVGDTENNKLLGLFRTFFRRFGDGRVELFNPTIMVRQDTQKWTLIHEMGHWLFAQNRARQAKMAFEKHLSDRSKALAQELRERRKDFAEEPTLAKAEQLTTLFEEFYQINMELFRRGPLEEFSIEAILSEKALQGEIDGIHLENDRTNAFFYMEANGVLAQEGLVNLGKLAENLRVSFGALPENQTPSSSLTRLSLMIEEDLKFIEENLKEAKAGLSLREKVPDLVPFHYDIKLFKALLAVLEDLNQDISK